MSAGSYFNEHCSLRFTENIFSEKLFRYLMRTGKPRVWHQDIGDLNLAFDNASVLNKIATEIKFDRSIGMNLTLIRI